MGTETKQRNNAAKNADIDFYSVMIPQRQAALEAIAELGGPQSTKLLVTHAGPKEYWPVRVTSLAALSSLAVLSAGGPACFKLGA